MTSFPPIVVCGLAALHHVVPHQRRLLFQISETTPNSGHTYINAHAHTHMHTQSEGESLIKQKARPSFRLNLKILQLF